MSETRLSAAVPVPEPADPMIGLVIGNYRIAEPLGHGAMGAVYRAHHVILGRPAAIKLLRPELTSSEELVRRFLNEAKAATAIRHPGVVEVYDFGYSEDGHAYLVMELLEGRPLSSALAQVGRFPEREAARIARGIASALKAAHAKGIIHRDLKPDNVILETDPEEPTGGPRPKVLDFGIAKLAEVQGRTQVTQAGTLIGTPIYMAPEQAREAASIDARADLYSLGCMLYELLVGDPPFLAEGFGEIIAMQLFAEPEPPRARVPELSPEIEAIVLRLLAKEPADRFQTAADVIAALAALGGGAPSRELGAILAGAGPGGASRELGASLGTAQTAAMPSAELTAPRIASTEQVVAPRRRLAPGLIAGLATAAIAAAAIVFWLVRATRDDATTTPAPAAAAPTAAAPVVAPPSPPAALALPAAPEPEEGCSVASTGCEVAPAGSAAATASARPATATPARPATRRPHGHRAGTPRPHRRRPTTHDGSPVYRGLEDSPRKATR